ncbi:MAG: hypothetical protein ACJ0BE_03235 [Dehalococcoidia bacterium]|jgi:hypothetical protein
MSKNLSRLILITIGLLISSVVILSSPDSVIAHGDMKEIHRSTIDDYDITVSILPHNPVTGGFSHLTIEPKYKKSQKSIEEALITVFIRNDSYAYKSRAVNTPDSPKLYDANFTFKEGGVWDIEVEISTIPEQFSTINFPLSVSGESVKDGREAGFFFLFVFSVLITGSIVLILRYRRVKN